MVQRDQTRSRVVRSICWGVSAGHRFEEVALELQTTSHLVLMNCILHCETGWTRKLL